ncbi:tripartite tricarboxylate transporter substrate-binding protein [Roseiarcaceae bacterium H3SJ34-1]|uniref:Bug family tripartite tricarboxylate transporter substrate binding protein n=1 Tax=Terripilifer ovatus TaxID=3032367 RepID=UPI003AB93B88|nr:tripartite tricarboxylate transporter substrate-binding protein [Roseiarcaceae bacterium H3SJ34-1]
MEWHFRRWRGVGRSLGAGALVLALGVNAGLAAEGEEFFKGRTISIITSTGAGGGYDLAARLIAQHMPKYIPGKPVFVVRNMPGGGHTRATNYIYAQAPKDGTTIGTVSNIIPMHQVVDGKGVIYDARRLVWIGSTGITNMTIAIWRAAGVNSIEDAYQREVALGATGVGSGTFIYPNVMNHVLGTKFKIVPGYQSSAEIDLATVRGEVSGRGGGSYSSYALEHPDWLRDGKVAFVAQIGIDPDRNLGKVPLMQDLAKNDEQRRILRFISSQVKVGRPFIAPPEIPADRLAIFRRAFDATMADEAFLADARKGQLELAPLNGEELTAVVREIVDTPPELVAKARAAIEPPQGVKGAAAE